MTTRRWLACIMLLAVTAAPATAQSVERQSVLERVSSAFERAMRRVEVAFDRAVSDHDVTQSRQAQDFEWKGSVPAGGSVEIKGVNGAIVAEAATGSELRVTARAHGRRSDPASVKVEVVEHEGGLTFCAVYPTPDGERENYCAPGSDGRMNTRRNDVEVEFHVELPAGVPFRGRTVNGEIAARDLRSDVDLATVNGDVDVSTSGFAEAETVNGSIEAAMGRGPSRDASFSTVNGSITLDVPDDLGAELDASWLNGSLDSDLPITLQGRMSRQHAHGVVGGGGPLISLKTVNGSIRLR